MNTKLFYIGLLFLTLFTLSNGNQFRRWRMVPAPNGPSNIGAHSMVSVASDLVVFGGVNEMFSTFTNIFYNDTWIFDTETTLQWEKVEPTTRPPARAFHTSVVVDGKMLMFGGLTIDGDFSNFALFGDLWSFDMSTKEWTDLTPVSGGPGARGLHGAAAIGGKMYIFGGIVDGFYTDVNDLWEYDVASDTWTELLANGATGSPSPRHSVQFRTVLNTKIVLYSGEETAFGAFTIPNDSWIYDSGTNTWTDITPAAEDSVTSGGRANFQASAVLGANNNKLIIYGGDVPGGSEGCGAVFANNVVDETWVGKLNQAGTSIRYTKLTPNTSPPALKRVPAAAVGNDVYVVGGYDFVCNNGIGPGQVWNNKLYVLEN